MSYSKIRPKILSLEKVKMENRTEELRITEPPSPNPISARRKKKNLIKTNEEMIQSSYEDLIEYIDTVDTKVQQIISTYEAQFLTAYQEHIKTVRQEMEDIKRRSLNSASSQSAYLEKIDALEKQMIIFREDSLKLFGKLAKREKEISLLNNKIKELQTTVREQESKILVLTKKNKENQVAFEKVKEQYLIQSIEEQKRTKRFTKSEHKNYNDYYSPFVKQVPEHDSSRPFSTQLRSNRSKNMSLKLDSDKKQEMKKQSVDVLWIREKIEEKVGNNNFVPVNTVIDLFAEKRMSESQTKRDPVSSFRRARTNYMTKMENKKSNSIQLDSQIVQKSKEMAENNQLKEILKNCIEQVRKEMTRRTKAPSLNFFKANGPKSYAEFKKVDNFALLQLLLNSEVLRKGLFNLIFDAA